MKKIFNFNLLIMSILSCNIAPQFSNHSFVSREWKMDSTGSARPFMLCDVKKRILAKNSSHQTILNALGAGDRTIDNHFLEYEIITGAEPCYLLLKFNHSKLDTVELNCDYLPGTQNYWSCFKVKHNENRGWYVE